MKFSAPWILAIVVLAVSPAEVFGRITNRLPAGGGSGAARNPVTNSRINSPAQQPAQRPAVQRPAQTPAQRPAVQRPAQTPAQRPAVQRPAQTPAIQRPAQLPAPPPSVQRPAARPVERPGNRPVTRPETLPNIRPVERPATLPSNRPITRPETLPNIRPVERPATLPGNVTFPRPNDRPNLSRPGGATPLPENITRPGGGITRPDNTLPDISRPGTGLRRPGGNTRPDFDLNRRPGNQPDSRPGWGNWGNWGNSNSPSTRPGDRPIFNNNNNNNNININIRNNQNWSYRPNYWGSRPWWGSRHHHHWHHGSWCYGWGRNSRRSFTTGFVWGVAAWSMGNWIFNSGYQNFHNPFPAPPVINNAGTTVINYTRPITVVAAELPPADEASELAASKTAASAMEEALAAFRKGDFPTALTTVDSAISAVPGDPAMHEFRALVFFSMGRFNDAAGVLNPILASGPGWDWTTMTGLFESQDKYTDLLRKLEVHHQANPDSAAANFLLGYHYLVLGHLEQALELFDISAKLEPTDTVSAGLRDLIRDSITNEEDDSENDADTPPPAPVDPDKLVGTWVSKVADDGTITLVMTKEGDFSWSFDKTDNSGKLAGEFGISDPNLLVFIAEDSQMAGVVTFAEDSKFSFVLVGGPRDDRGLTFVRKP